MQKAHKLTTQTLFFINLPVCAKNSTCIVLTFFVIGTVTLDIFHLALFHYSEVLKF